MGAKLSFAALKEFLKSFRDAHARSGSTVGKLEYGIIYIATQIAALDGAMTDEEVRLIADFAWSCPGASLEGKQKGLDFALRRAGYLAVIAQFPEYTEERRLDAFLEAVEEGLVDKFPFFDREQLCFAFTFWTVLAMSDGDFSSIERKAIEALKARVDYQRAVRKQAEIDNAKRVAAYSTDYDKTIEQLAGKRELALKDEDFVARAEALFNELQKNG